MAVLTDFEAEASLIGSVWSGLQLSEPSARRILFDATPELFFGKEHRAAWTGMQRLVGDRDAALSELELSWRVFGGKASEAQRLALGELLLSGSDLDPEPLLVRVQELSMRRAAVRAAQSVIQAAEDLLIPPEEVVTASNSAFLEIARGGARRAIQIHSGLDIFERLAEGVPFRPPGERGVRLGRTGLSKLDELVEFTPGHILLTGAGPGGGKTTLGLQSVIETALMGVDAGFLSLEMDDDEVSAKIGSYFTGIPYRQLRDLGAKNLGQLMEELRERVPAFQRIHRVCMPSGRAVGTVLSYAQDMVEVFGVKFLCLDYFQYVGIRREKGRTDAIAYAENSAALKTFAQDHRIFMHVLSQLTREGRKESEPRLSDFKETSQLEQDASAALMLWVMGDQLQAKTAKNRDGDASYRSAVNANWGAGRMREAEFETNPWRDE